MPLPLRAVRMSVRAALLLCCGAGLAAAQQGTITGRVISQETNTPVPDARVMVVGTSLVAATNPEGRYTLRNVPAGTQAVRAMRVGFIEQRKTISVATASAATLDFTLEQAVVRLQEVVTTATGDQQRSVELGNAVATIDAARITETAPISNIQDVLAARTPGVTVQTGSQVGGGARVRIRGNSSLNLSNDPIYVIDGIRMTSNTNSSNLFTGGSQPNRANDINPDEIESIEIVKGPSAATLYGTDAANGVIVITTKKGRAGAARWTTWLEGGVIKDNTDYPLNYTIAGHSPGATAYRECTLSVVASGTCVMDSVRTYSPLRDPDATPVSNGYRNQVGVSASGGTETIRYLISGEREQETAILKLPSFERRRFDSSGVDITDEMERPNALHRYSFRANLNASPSSKLDLGVTTNFVHLNSRFVTESNATAGLGSQIFGGKGYKENGVISGLEAGTPTTPLTGYRAWTPGYTFQELNQQRLNRVLMSGNAAWRPFSWMQNRASVGIDYLSRVDVNFLRRGEGPPVNSTYRLGFKDDFRAGIRTLSADLSSAGTWNPTDALSFKTTLGAQYVNYQLDANRALGQELAPGTSTPNSARIPTATEATTTTKTLGAFVEEQLAFRERLFLTAAVRSDQNSAFGTDFQRVFYPKFAASWILSEEDFFPRPTWIDQFRLRSAYGASGVQPGPNDALRSFAGATANIKGTDAPAVLYTAVGNSELKPERTTEYEGGFELRMFSNRANLELTYYTKTTKDALIDWIIPPSAGAANDVKRNLGSVKNAGLEGLFSSQIVSTPRFGFDVTVTGSMNDNKLVTLGLQPNGDPLPPVISTTWRATPGYPLFGFWARPILGWEDKDKNGILTYNADANLNEVFVGKDTIFRGYSTPRYTATVLPGFDLFDRKLRIGSLFEYKGGYKYYNNTERIRCASRQNCSGLMNPDASFEDQAMAVAHLIEPSRTLDGFFQPASFVRWRELSATVTLPERWAGRYLRSRSASFNFGARNLHIWTNYRGLDPEIDRLAGSSNNAPPEEFQTMGQPTYFTFRLNLGF
jgi:TonB-linked SusC/RagA family outer membrane protein